jgi:hypothetical protein
VHRGISEGIGLRMGEMDGKDTIYNDDGNPIRSPGERILVEKHDVLCRVRKSGKFKFIMGKPLIDWRRCDLFKTNLRIVMIMEPMKRALNFQYTGGYPFPVSSTILEKDRGKIKKNIKRYFQFQLDEIEQWKKDLLGGYKIFIKDKDSDDEYVVNLSMTDGDLQLTSSQSH